MDAEWLQRILNCGDAEACLQFFAGATEEERRLASKTVLASLQGIEQERMFLHLVGASGCSPWRDARGVALLASCSLEELRHERMTLLPNSDYVCRVLADRRPEWIDDFPDAVLEFSRGYWPLVRRVVRDKLCRKPKSDIYVIGMLCSMRSWCASEDKTLRDDLLDDPELLDDEIWRLFEVAGSAECNLASSDSRSPAARRWDRTLIALSREGRLSRERLLDASLEALARDFRPYLAAWFSRFHESLEPTDAERVERTERYLALWSSRVSTTVAFAVRAVKYCDKIKPIDGRILIECTRPALHAPRKGTVKSVLTLLGRLARRSPCVRQALVLAVAEGLSHKNVDVQEAVLRFLERFGDCDKDLSLAEAILRHRGHVAPSLRHRAGGLLGVTPVPTEDRSADPAWDLSKLESRISRLDPELAELAGVGRSLEAFQDGKLDLTTVEFDGTEIPRLNPDAELQPVTELKNLIDICSKVLDEPWRIDDVELALDGISRLCSHMPADFEDQVNSLKKQAKELIQGQGIHSTCPFLGRSVRLDLAGVIASWTTGHFSRPKRIKSFTGETVWRWSSDRQSYAFPRQQRGKVLGFLSRRSLDIAKRASRRDARPLLSTPTHADGWIDPVALVQRAKARQRYGGAGPSDRILALLRLAPDRRGEALRLASELTNEFGCALRYALGDSRVSPGRKADLWVAASRVRAPFDDDLVLHREYGQLGPDGALAARYTWEVGHVTRTYGGHYDRQTMNFYPFHLRVEPDIPKGTGHDLVTILFHSAARSPENLGGKNANTVRWVATIWPIARESFFAAGARAIAMTMDGPAVHRENPAYLEPLLDPDTPLKPMALLLVALGLAAREPAEHDVAVKVLTAAIEDGRVDDVKLGDILGQLLPTGLIYLARWAKTLGRVARTSPLHALVIRLALERSLRGTPSEQHRSFHALLDTYKELVFDARDGVRSESARRFLRQIKATRKAAKTAKILLDCKVRDLDDSVARIMPAVVQSRVERAERWTRWKRL
jgi:hypothetical protein